MTPILPSEFQAILIKESSSQNIPRIVENGPLLLWAS
jgi:hypothetical protein